MLADVTPDMGVAREEIFGPLAALFRFMDEADVIRQANDTEFGLASYFYAKDLARVFRVAEALEYGMVGANTGSISTAEAPFGGVKLRALAEKVRNMELRNSWSSNMSVSAGSPEISLAVQLRGGMEC